MVSIYENQMPTNSVCKRKEAASSRSDCASLGGEQTPVSLIPACSLHMLFTMGRRRMNEFQSECNLCPVSHKAI